MILGIESSCDETSAAVFHPQRGLLSNVISSQAVHERFGGVVPELASRAHHTHISHVVAQALAEADITTCELSGIAVANGPGLMGALLVGMSFAKGLHMQLGVPLVGVNHLDAHIYANFIESAPEYPFVALIVSGGHTRLLLVRAFMDHELLGDTRDDAAGEAFDKTGKLLGLPYPAGPEMDKRSQGKHSQFVNFPKSLLNDGYEFSFSGLKTAVLYHLQAVPEADRAAYIEANLGDLCASISDAITTVLVTKTMRAVKETGVNTVVLAGGVSANSMLRNKFAAAKGSMRLHIPRPVLCTDNGAMIAVTGSMMMDAGLVDGLDLKAFATGS
jgi:N6-L-threonylcarbamoyladenine synthase